MRITTVMLLAGVAPSLLSLAASRWLREALFFRENLHEALELSGSCIAFAVAMLLLLRVRHEWGQGHFLWAAAALIGMGLVGAIQAIMPFGLSWSWLHHLMTLVGGVTFGLIWVPLPEAAATRKKFIVLGVLVLSAAAAAAICYWPDKMPEPWRAGAYTLPVKAVNVLGGAGFLAAAIFFLRRYARIRRTEHLVFAAHTLLFSAAGFFFGFTQTWAADWWLWQALRLIAYAIVLLAAYEMIVGLYQSMEGQAKLLEARVIERTAALQRSEEQFRLATQATNEVIWDWDLLTNHVDWNGAVQAQFGHTLEELGHAVDAWTDRLHPEDRDRTVTGLHHAIAGSATHWSGEYRMRRKDGSYGLFIDRSMIARDAAGKAYRVVGSMTDVTHERQAREAQQATSDLLAGIINGTTDEIAAIDTNFRFLAFNRPFRNKFAQIFGVDIQIGTNGIDVMAHVPADQKNARELWSRALDGEVFVTEQEFGDPTRARQTFDLSFGPIGDRNGRLIGAALISRDVTEYKRMENALRESEQRFRIMGETLPYGVWRCNAQGVPEYVSQSLLDLVEMTLEELRDLGWTRRIRADEVEEAAGRWNRFLAGEQEWDAEYHVLGPDGKYHAVLMRGKPVRDAAGNIQGWVGINLDVDARDRQQEALRAAQAQAEQARLQAEQANRAKDHFLAVLSHELRTPLTPVLTTLTLMQQQEGEYPQSLRDDLEMIRRNVEMEARLIDDLLDVTRIVRGKIELERQPVELCQIVRRAAEVCRAEIQARELDFTMDCGPNAPYTVNADPSRLQQVFWNLLKNAIKFTPHGGSIAVLIREDDGHVVVDVKDSGQGIEPDVLPRIFNAFEQGGMNITRQFGGLGLGLSITKGLVEMHGGNVEAYSEGKDRGSTFRVRLPLVSAAAEPAILGAREPKAAAKPLRILVVEDHPDTAQIMVRLLSKQGHQAEAACDVTTALQRSDSSEFDLLISDLGLPDGSGVELLLELRRRGRQLPAIALSGYGQEQDVRRSTQAGFAAHLVKPVSAARLAETIGQVTGR